MLKLQFFVGISATKETVPDHQTQSKSEEALHPCAIGAVERGSSLSPLLDIEELNAIGYSQGYSLWNLILMEDSFCPVFCKINWEPRNIQTCLKNED